jgi:hypothetical protein
MEESRVGKISRKRRRITVTQKKKKPTEQLTYEHGLL